MVHTQTMNSLNWKRYLLWFAQEHVEFRFQEIESLLAMMKIPMKYTEKPTEIQPYWLVEFRNDNDVKKLASRSVSLRSCLELWGHAQSIPSLHDILKQNLKVVENHLTVDKSFKIEVETFCKHFTQQEKVAKIETFDYLPYKGPVRLKNPDVCLQYIEHYGTDPKTPPELPYQVFFGRLIATGLRQLIKHLSLKTRKFIGNTSMDPQLSLLMANQAQIQEGDLVLDPFVGSGSLLVAAAQFGGYVLGTDIDYLMLHARTRPSRIQQNRRAKDESVKSNMAQYNLEKHYVDVVVNDFAMPCWREDLIFDSILTDPPYGIRESTERIGTTKKDKTISEEHLKTHIPAKIEYGISHIYSDLLSFAAQHLKLNGRLVCWFPVFRDDYHDEGLPQHPSLKLVHNSEQVLSKHTSRRLLTYQKIVDDADCDAACEASTIKDFRFKYYEAREETRKERRMKKAAEREHARLQTLQKRHE